MKLSGLFRILCEIKHTAILQWNQTPHVYGNERLYKAGLLGRLI